MRIIEEMVGSLAVKVSVEQTKNYFARVAIRLHNKESTDSESLKCGKERMTKLIIPYMYTIGRKRRSI